jgi:predicted dehydrogenase
MLTQHGVDAVTTAQLRFPDGPDARLHCSMIDERRDASLTLRGEHGRLTIHGFVLPQLGCVLRVRIGDEIRVEPTAGPTSYAAQLEHLVSVMRDGEPPLTGGADAIANLALMAAIRAQASPIGPM